MRANYTNPRRTGNNARARFTNPRERGTNPRARAAGAEPSEVEAARRYRRAVAIWRRRFGGAVVDVLGGELLDSGRPLCSTCEDLGMVETPDGWAKCPTHRTLSPEEVAALLAL